VVTFTVKQLKNIHSCFGNTEKASNFAGTLLDFSPNKLTVAKLNPYMLYKSSLDTDLCSFSRRLLLPSSAGDFCKTFEKKIRDIYLGYNKIAIKLNNGVAVIIPELQDDYTENYDIFFNNNASTFFLADKEELTQTINLVADVAGVENTDVSIAVAGVDPNTKNSVIKISSSLFDGTFASELLVIQNKVTQEVQETCIKSAHILSSLKAYEGTVKLVITQRSCILSDLGNTIYIVLAAREL
jgi:hypothetical protein